MEQKSCKRSRRLWSSASAVNCIESSPSHNFPGNCNRECFWNRLYVNFNWRMTGWKQDRSSNDCSQTANFGYSNKVRLSSSSHPRENLKTYRLRRFNASLIQNSEGNCHNNYAKKIINSTCVLWFTVPRCWLDWNVLISANKLNLWIQSRTAASREILPILRARNMIENRKLFSLPPSTLSVDNWYTGGSSSCLNPNHLF